MSGNFDFLRFLLLALGVLAVLNWSRRGRRWRRISNPHRLERSEAELAALETRLAAVEQLQARVEELENRVDFAERLMAGREAVSFQRGATSG
jgi:hypothetical protein